MFCVLSMTLSSAQELAIDTLKRRVEYRDSSLVMKMSNQARIDTLSSQVKDLKNWIFVI